MSQFVADSSPWSLVLARQQLRAVGRSYAGRRAAASVLPALAEGLLLLLLDRHWPTAQGGLTILAGLGLVGTGWLLWPLRQLRPATIAPRLDRHFPSLEDSTGLLLRDANDLNLLEQIQQQRVAQQLAKLRAARVLSLPVSFRRSQAASANGLSRARRRACSSLPMTCRL